MQSPVSSTIISKHPEPSSAGDADIGGRDSNAAVGWEINYEGNEFDGSLFRR